MTIFAPRFNICSPNLGERRRIFPPICLRAHVTVIDGHVGLIFLL